MGSVFIEVVILWYDMLVTILCTIPFQNFVVIPDTLQVCELPFLQPVVLCCQFFQRRYLSIER